MRVEKLMIMKLLFVVAFFSGCQKSATTGGVTPSNNAPTATPSSAPAESPLLTDKWLGRWQGVEGTYLTLSKSGDTYLIEIANLDGPKTYKGLPVGDHIEFKRDGKVESIRAGTGKDTGMKWLAEEKNCLVVKVGSEGFCRK